MLTALRLRTDSGASQNCTSVLPKPNLNAVLKLELLNRPLGEVYNVNIGRGRESAQEGTVKWKTCPGVSVTVLPYVLAPFAPRLVPFGIGVQYRGDPSSTGALVCRCVAHVRVIDLL